MGYRNLLVHLDNTESSRSRIGVAVTLAQRFGAGVTGLFALADAHVQSLASREARRVVLVEADEVEARFRAAVAEADVAAEWFAIATSSDRQVSEEVIIGARHCDMAILGQFDSQRADGGVRSDLVEEATWRAGRPLLVIPFAGTFAAVGRRAVIAWNGTREAVRALNDALPLLEGARSVTVVNLAPEERPRRKISGPFADIRRHLSWHHIEATVESIGDDADPVPAAERLLSMLAEEDADLLVMGGPSRSASSGRYGRAFTRQVLSEMTVPVLMAN